MSRDIRLVHDDSALRGLARPVEKLLNSQQQEFVFALNQAVRLLDYQGLRRESWMIIAGGAVFLHQLDLLEHGRLASVDRVPTDLDMVVGNYTEKKHVLEVLRDGLHPHKSSLNTEPVYHFGHLLKGPTLQTTFSNGMAVDFITELSQQYPSNHRFAPSLEYKYPSTPELFSSAVLIRNPLIDGEVRVAHPGFIAFYKLMLARNTNGKQDQADLLRLKEMGLLERSPELDKVIGTLCHGDRKLIDALQQAIRDL